MPYEIVREPRGVHKRFWGMVTPGEFLDSVKSFHNDPHFDSVRYTINDFSDVEGFVMEETHIEQTAAINVGAAYTNPNIRVIVVTRDPRIIGLTKKYDQLTGAEPVAIFPDLQQARHLLARV